MSFAGGGKRLFAWVVKSQKLQVHQEAAVVSDGKDSYLNEQLASNLSEGEMTYAHPLYSEEAEFLFHCSRSLSIRGS